MVADLMFSKEIVKHIRAGNSSSFEKLYHFFFHKLSYFSSQYLFDVEEANDIVQEVFTELWDRREQLDKDTNIQAWLFTVTKNKSLKRLQKMKSKLNYLNYIEAREMDVNYKALESFDTGDFLFKELEQKIEASLKELSPAVRTVFEKSRFEEMKNREIADDLGISIKTVEAHISKALKILRRDLQEYLSLFFL